MLNHRNWYWSESKNNLFLKCTTLHNAGFEHAFFTKNSGFNSPKKLAHIFEKSKTLHLSKQVHGKVVLEASQTNSVSIKEADALVSENKGETLWVCTADCLPILIGDTKTGNVASCHAGWRGIASRILIEVINKMKKKGSKVESLIVAIGPSISGKRYPVDVEVLELIKQGIKRKSPVTDKQEKWILKESRQKETKKERILNKKFYISISLAASEQLIRDAGLIKDQILISPYCTFEEEGLFHSWRRDRIKAVQWSAIVAN